jgi:hypothetical protein
LLSIGRVEARHSEGVQGMGPASPSSSFTTGKTGWSWE